MKKSNNFSNVPKTLTPEEDAERSALIRKLDICKYEFFNFSLPPLPGTKDEIDVAVLHVPRHTAAINLMRTYGSGC